MVEQEDKSIIWEEPQMLDQLIVDLRNQEKGLSQSLQGYILGSQGWMETSSDLADVRGLINGLQGLIKPTSPYGANSQWSVRTTNSNGRFGK